MNYALNEEKMFADITDGVAIVINSETGIYYGMNALGTAVFENILNGASIENIAQTLKKLPNVPENIEAKLNNFVQSLLKFELLIETEANDAQASFSENACSEGFEMSVNEYNDAQELLLADPIHEVKEETGWTPEMDSIGYTKEETKKREKKIQE